MRRSHLELLSVSIKQVGFIILFPQCYFPSGVRGTQVEQPCSSVMAPLALVHHVLVCREKETCQSSEQ